MAEDLVSEIRKEISARRMRAWMRRGGFALAVVITAFLLAGGGWWWRDHARETHRLRASEQYFHALRLPGPGESGKAGVSDENARKEARSLLEGVISADNPEGIAAYARLRLAEMARGEGKNDEALDLWDQVAKAYPPQSALGGFSRFMILNLRSEMYAGWPSAKKREDLIAQYRAFMAVSPRWSALAREELAALLMAAGNAGEVQKLEREIARDGEGTDSGRMRAQEISGILSMENAR